MKLLSTSQMATFAAKGCLRFDGLIGDELNQKFLGLFGEGIGVNDPEIVYIKNKGPL